jgi:hypothetical protein
MSIVVVRLIKLGIFERRLGEIVHETQQKQFETESW